MIRRCAIGCRGGPAQFCPLDGPIGAVQEVEQQRVAEAAVTASEVARTGSEVEEVRGAVAVTEGELIGARAALSVAVGLPPRALDSIGLAPAVSGSCVRLDSLGADSLETLALSTRPEIAGALAGYAGAEAQLRLQVA